MGLGLDLLDKGKYSSIVGVLDSHNIVKSPHHPGPSLKVLLKSLQIPNRSLHTAGNDSNFTLRALFMLVALSFENQALDVSQKASLLTLRALAQEAIASEKPHRCRLTWNNFAPRQSMKAQRKRTALMEWKRTNPQWNESDNLDDWDGIEDYGLSPLMEGEFIAEDALTSWTGEDGLGGLLDDSLGCKLV